jgi:hypothetical protein
LSLGTILIAAEPAIALHAERCGVSTILVDMETRGKAERQGHLDTHKAAHTLEDVARLAGRLTRAELMARINPCGEDTAAEVDAVLAAGARRLMLPMFREAAEVSAFKGFVAGRAPVTLLVETAAALARLPGVLALCEPGDRIHFGLNDLCIDMRLAFLFEALGGRLLDGAAALCRERRVPFGVGGVGRIGRGSLPAEWIVGEHARLGSEWIILSRSFHGGARTLAELEETLDLAAEIAALQAAFREFASAGAAEVLENHARLARRAAELAGQAV